MIDMIDYSARKARSGVYESGVDFDMSFYPFIFHLGVINWNGSGKDLLINADIYKMYVDGVSIFDDVIKFVFNRPFYKSDIKNIYSNARLNCEVYGDDYYLVRTRRDVGDCVDGVLYLHDAERYLNSIGLNLRGEDKDLIDFVNNKRKDGIIFRLSLHHFESIHIRVRELIPCWVKPDLFLLDSSDSSKASNYVIKYKVCDFSGNVLFVNTLSDLALYCGLYDTLEKAKSFSADDL